MKNVRLLLLLTLVTACDDSANGEVLRLIDDVITIGNQNVEIVCDCWDEAGFESRAVCLDDQILPSQRRCVEDAYLRDADASELFLSCVTPLMGELGECLDARLSCTEPDLVDARFADYDLGRESCVVVPQSVQRALDDCSVGGGDDGDAPGESSATEESGSPGTGEDTGGDTAPDPDSEDDGPAPPQDTGTADEGPAPPDDSSTDDGPAPPDDTGTAEGTDWPDDTGGGGGPSPP